jgi:hypothetical protein
LSPIIATKISKDSYDAIKKLIPFELSYHASSKLLYTKNYQNKRVLDANIAVLSAGKICKKNNIIRVHQYLIVIAIVYLDYLFQAPLILK